MATVELGPYKGAKLLGSLQPTGKYAKGVALRFTTMTMPQYKSSISITAYAIDPDTARTAVASDVDHHYLMRYGTLFASSFLSGYGQAIESSGQTTVNSQFGGNTQTLSDLNNKDKFLYALGNVGTQAGNEMGDLFHRPATITVNSGTGIGILYMQDVPKPGPDQATTTR